MQNYFSGLEKKKLFLEIPFSKGFALQNYRCAEYGIIEANNNEYQYWYIDFSMGSDQIKNWTQDRIINLLILINKFKVKPIFHGNFKAPIVSDVDEIRKAAIEYTKNEIDIAYQFSSPLIIHAGAIVEPRTVRQAKQKALDDLLLSLEKLIEYANDFGVELWLENLSNYKHCHPFYYIFTNFEEFEYIMSRCPKIKFFLDIGHANIGNNNIEEVIEKYHKRIVGISLSNNNGINDQHINFNKGTVDYKNIISMIIKLEWKGIVSLEIRGSNPLKNLIDLYDIYQEAIKIKK